MCTQQCRIFKPTLGEKFLPFATYLMPWDIPALHSLTGNLNACYKCFFVNKNTQKYTNQQQTMTCYKPYCITLTLPLTAAIIITHFNNKNTHNVIFWARQQTMKEHNNISQEAGTKNILCRSKLVTRLSDDRVHHIQTRNFVFWTTL